MVHIMSHTMSGFAQLKQWLDGLPNQVKGFQAAICETGEPYVEFVEDALCRPDDVGLIEAHIANRMARRITEYLNGKSGRIYWRVPLECQIEDSPQIDSFDENGPDKDFMTRRACILDRNWKSVSLYCRLYRATWAIK